MRLRKILSMAAIAASIFSFNVSADAQVVTVNGAGATEQAATQDAKRNAVEQVVGTYLKSRSIAQDLELVIDAIDTRTQGYVNSFEIIKRSTNQGLITITARVDVSNEPNSSLMKDVELVVSLNDPRIGVVTEYYGDDGGESFKKYPAMCKAAIREELIKRGFTHIIDTNGDIDYVIIGNMTVEKTKGIKLPTFGSLNGGKFETAETGLSKSIATMDCRIKKASTDELIGEFHARGESGATTEDDAGSQAVLNLAADAAQQVKNLFAREAAKVFTSVKIIATTNDADKVLKLEETLRRVSQVSSVYVRSFANGKCTIDVGTDLTPQQLYRLLVPNAQDDDLNLKLLGFSSVVLEIDVK